MNNDLSNLDCLGLLEQMVLELKCSDVDGYTMPSARFVRAWTNRARDLIQADRDGGMAQALEMAKNMHQYGTIDVPSDSTPPDNVDDGPVGYVMKADHLPEGYDRKIGDVIWYRKPPPGSMLYAIPSHPTHPHPHRHSTNKVTIHLNNSWLKVE